MKRLLPSRGLPRWLIALAGLSLLLVATVGVVPHGDEDQSCLACKARHQPLEKFPALLLLDAPPSSASRATSDDVLFVRTVVAESTAPRAPPA